MFKRSSFLFCILYTLAVTNSFAEGLKPNYQFQKDSVCDDSLSQFISKEIAKPTQSINIYEKRLKKLNDKSPINLDYNEHVQKHIDAYLAMNKKLISSMLSRGSFYFPDIEQRLDKYNLPLELKYLAIVESSLNPKARSKSGACGLWQFMYSTGKQYNLDVTSYIDERYDPIKSTEAACQYFLKLYDTFGDWNLVLAAYNGGPGYVQRLMLKTGCNNFWDLRTHLREETKNYVPLFIAINYVMEYHSNHDIKLHKRSVYSANIDTIRLKSQVEYKVIKELLCIPIDTLRYLNPSLKKDIFPKNTIAYLPKRSIEDFLINEEVNYHFIEAVENKEILIDEDRIVYKVKKGDYLGKIANKYELNVFQIKSWNNLLTSNIDIDDELVLFVKNKKKKDTKNQSIPGKKYIVQEGDTLWDIAKKQPNLSIWKIKEYNNLDSDLLKPGNTIVLPVTN